MGSKPSPKHQIHRIDNDGNCEPGNCRWVTALEHAKNRRPSRKPQRTWVRFKRRETARLLRSALDAGLTVRGVELDPTGTLRVLVGEQGKPDDVNLDRELAER